MPIVEITIVEGRDERMIRLMMEDVTEAVARSLAISPERIRVIVREVPERHWAVGGVPFSDRRQVGLAARTGREVLEVDARRGAASA